MWSNGFLLFFWPVVDFDDRLGDLALILQGRIFDTGEYVVYAIQLVAFVGGIPVGWIIKRHGINVLLTAGAIYLIGILIGIEVHVHTIGMPGRLVIVSLRQVLLGMVIGMMF